MSKMIASILYCHERNVCHRDVKLDNFVYESNGEDAELKLIDFGLSHVLLHTQVRARVGARVRVNRNRNRNPNPNPNHNPNPHTGEDARPRGHPSAG